MNSLGKVIPLVLFLVSVFLCFVSEGKYLKPRDQNTQFTGVGDDRRPKELGILSRWNQNESRPHTTRNDILIAPPTESPSESLILGPLEISNVRNSSLKRVRLSPGFEKVFRDEIFRYNFRQEGKHEVKDESEKLIETNDKKGVKRFPRSAQLLGESISKRQGLGLAATGVTPQQFLFMQQQYQQQQQQEARALLLQQQMLSMLQNHRYNGVNRRQNQNIYDEHDDDDSDSDEDDEFDSQEFMSFPMRNEFMPSIMNGFNGKK